MPTDSPSFSWLSGYPRDESNWTVQQVEAVALYSVVAMLQPRRSVEFGFYRGHSATAILEATEAGELWSVDREPHAAPFALHVESHYPGRFHFVAADHTDPTLPDALPHSIDFAFLDGSHDFDVNRTLLDSVTRLLSPKCVLAVHDTGVYCRRVHQPGERATVNWLQRERGWAAVHLHCSRERRHGLTLLQRPRTLSI